MSDTIPDLDDTHPFTILKRRVPWSALVYVTFWSWHAIWGLCVVFGMVPYLLPDLIGASFDGIVPWGITATALVLTVLPFLTALGGRRLHGDPRRVFRFFFGVGGVAGALLLVRLFWIREATLAVDYMLATLALGVAVYAVELFGSDRDERLAMAVARVVGGSALLVIGVYTAVTAVLYAVPAIALAVPGFFRAVWYALTSGDLTDVLAHSLMGLLFLAFAMYTMALLLGLPIAVAVLYPQAWWRAVQRWSKARPRWQALAISGGAVTLWLLGFSVVTTQPQREAFARTAEPPADLQAQRDNAEHAEVIADGLLNAYLARYRYWGVSEDNHHLARLYREAFFTDADVMGPQGIFNRFAGPILYDGASMTDARLAAEVRYEQFFDAPIQQREREAVLQAVASTYDRDRAEAGLLDVGRRRVLLSEQTLEVHVDGDLARFSLHEVYANKTPDDQEILYYFSLPESAAITSLKLGFDENTEFDGVIAPRGAAQQVYKDFREARRDPALLEQVGPRQYRLRVYPILADRRSFDVEWEPTHLRMEWTVAATDGQWPLPVLAEARNVYWDETTVRRIDGRPSEHEGWLPSSIPADATPRSHTVVLSGTRITATPVASPPGALAGRLAVVVDTSRSMAEHADEVVATLDGLAAQGIDADIYEAPSPFSAAVPRRVDPERFEPHYYGGHTLAGVLARVAALRGDREYAAVVVLSDAGSTAMLQDQNPPPARARWDGRVDEPPAAWTEQVQLLTTQLQAVADAEWSGPVWLVHLGGLPHAYRDEIGDLLGKTHGGVATDLDTVLRRLADDDVVDGYRWQVALADGEAAADPAFEPLAARMLVRALARQGDASLPSLDRMHEVAVSAHVVTPWSSLLVLVDEIQREALARADAADDRFDREAESGTEVTTAPHEMMTLNATPEPEEWILLALAAGVLLFRLRP